MIVAHPDDETLWSGGTILKYPRWHWEIHTLCRTSDPDRSDKFYRMLSVYGANGIITDYDDRPKQRILRKSISINTHSDRWYYLC